MEFRSEEHTSELQSRSDLVCRIIRSEEHTSELQSRSDLVCRLLLEKKKTNASHCARTGSLSPSLDDPRRSRASSEEVQCWTTLVASAYLLMRVHIFFVFFFNDTATTEIYTLSLHDALPIFGERDQLVLLGLFPFVLVQMGITN